LLWRVQDDGVVDERGADLQPGFGDEKVRGAEVSFHLAPVQDPTISCEDIVADGADTWLSQDAVDDLSWELRKHAGWSDD
jgi:hypothetical protein